MNVKFLVGSKEHTLPVFHIDGSNYFKLRDLSDIVGIDMEWDKEKNGYYFFLRFQIMPTE